MPNSVEKSIENVARVLALRGRVEFLLHHSPMIHSSQIQIGDRVYNSTLCAKEIETSEQYFGWQIFLCCSDKAGGVEQYHLAFPWASAPFVQRYH